MTRQRSLKCLLEPLRTHLHLHGAGKYMFVGSNSVFCNAVIQLAPRFGPAIALVVSLKYVLMSARLYEIELNINMLLANQSLYFHKLCFINS